jgi:hypothetical protein
MLEVLDFPAELVDFPLLVLEEVGDVVQLPEHAGRARAVISSSGWSRSTDWSRCWITGG